jgi:hypothetical protein
MLALDAIELGAQLRVIGLPVEFAAARDFRLVGLQALLAYSGLLSKPSTGHSPVTLWPG